MNFENDNISRGLGRWAIGGIVNANLRKMKVELL